MTHKRQKVVTRKKNHKINYDKSKVVLKKEFSSGDIVKINDFYFRVTAVGNKGVSLVITDNPWIFDGEDSIEGSETDVKRVGSVVSSLKNSGLQKPEEDNEGK